MTDHAPPTSSLATCAVAAATRIGQQLPAAFDLVPGPVLLDGDAAAHPMPEDAVAVRWPVEGQDAALVVALHPATAQALREQAGADVDLVAALTARLGDLADLAPLFEGAVPALGEGAEVPAAQALATGPGDAVSVSLDDAGSHRATVGLRMVVGDDLLAGSGATADGDPEGAEPVAAVVDEPAPDAAPAPAVAGEPLAQPAAAAGAGAVQLDAADAAPAGAVPLQSVPQGPAGGAPLGQPAAAPAQELPPVQPGVPAPQAHPAEFASFDQLTALPGAARSMAMLGEVEMGVTAELGRTRMTVREVLGLTPGAIIELDRAAGSPVDVVVNGTLIARGEVVVIDEEFGIRITEIIGAHEEASPFPQAAHLPQQAAGLQVAQ